MRSSAASSSSRRPCALGRREPGDPFGRGRERRRGGRPGRRGCRARSPGGSCRSRASRRRTTHVVDPLPERVRLVAAPGELRGVELEVLGWRTWDGRVDVAVPAGRWQRRGDPGGVDGSAAAGGRAARSLGVLASPAAWRLFASAAGAGAVASSGARRSLRRNGGDRVGAVGAGGSEERVVAAAVWETLPVEVQREVTVRLARLLARLVEAERDE